MFGIAKMQIIFYNRIAKKKCRMTVLWAVILFYSALWQGIFKQAAKRIANIRFDFGKQMTLGAKGILPPMIHGLLRISCSRNPKTPQIRSFFYEKMATFRCFSGQ